MAINNGAWDGQRDWQKVGRFICSDKCLDARALSHCVCDWDWLSVWAWRFVGLVTEIDCAQLCSWGCLGECPAHRVWSRRLQILNFRGVLFPDPIKRCHSHKLNIYSVSHPPSPVFPSHSAFVKHLFHSVTILEHFCFIYLFFLPFFFFFFNLDLDLSVEQECHLVSLPKIAHNFAPKHNLEKNTKAPKMSNWNKGQVSHNKNQRTKRQTQGIVNNIFGPKCVKNKLLVNLCTAP